MSMAPAPSRTLPFAPALLGRRTLSVVAGSLLIAACAHISVPLFFTPVPMTLQPFAVLLIGLLLRPGLGAAACAAYLLEGAAGLPVFTPQGPGGILQLLGPTGGYLLCYPGAAAVAGMLFSGRARLSRAVLGAGAAHLLILSCGAGWLMLLTHQSAIKVAHAAVLPFVAGDLIKVALASLVAVGWRRCENARLEHTPTLGDS